MITDEERKRAINKERLKTYEGLRTKVEISKIKEFSYYKHVEDKQSHKVFAIVNGDHLNITKLCKCTQTDVSNSTNLVILNIPIVVEDIYIEYHQFGYKYEVYL